MKTILLAEDDRNLGMVLSNELRADGYAVDFVTDGVGAVLSFIEKSYDFVLVDIRMPRLSGTDALRIIKKLNPLMPCIAMSGCAGQAEMEESIASGASTCLGKPFQIARLKDEILNTL